MDRRTREIRRVIESCGLTIVECIQNGHFLWTVQDAAGRVGRMSSAVSPGSRNYSNDIRRKARRLAAELASRAVVD